MVSTHLPARRLSVAPMMEWTDRHCRYFHRLLSKNTWLYTEMVTTGALLYGDIARHLAFHEAEHPVALQLGGSEPKELAKSARLGMQWGYDEINLNCGCPSERVQRGAFGACLMAEPALVADCVRAMLDEVNIPVTVKHRIGINEIQEYGFVRDFIGSVADAGCKTFIVHARNAILKGLSPKENREIPPLRYEVAWRLKQEFPDLELIVNGGICTWEAIATQLVHVDGVMIGREAYHNPMLLSQFDARYYGAQEAVLEADEVERLMMRYAQDQVGRGVYLGAITRHLLGLHRGRAGARGWRRILSDNKRLTAARNETAVEAVFAEAKSYLTAAHNDAQDSRGEQNAHPL